MMMVKYQEVELTIIQLFDLLSLNYTLIFPTVDKCTMYVRQSDELIRALNSKEVYGPYMGHIEFSA